MTVENSKEVKFQALYETKIFEYGGYVSIEQKGQGITSQVINIPVHFLDSFVKAVQGFIPESKPAVRKPVKVKSMDEETREELLRQIEGQ